MSDQQHTTQNNNIQADGAQHFGGAQNQLSPAGQPAATPAAGTQPAATPAAGTQPATTPAAGTQPAAAPQSPGSNYVTPQMAPRSDSPLDDSFRFEAVSGAGMPSVEELRQASGHHYDPSDPLRHKKSKKRRRRSSHRRRRRARIIKRVLLALLIVLVICGALAALVGVRLVGSSKVVREDAKVVMSQLDSMLDAANDGNAEGLRAASEEISEAAHRIDRETSGIEWTLGTFAPVYGQDIRSAKTLSRVLVDLADNAVTPIGTSSNALNLSDLVQNGRINVDLLSQFSEAVNTAAPVLQRSAATIQSLPEPRLEQLASILNKVKEPIQGGSNVIQAVQAFLPFAPSMLGANGPRNYMVLAQNNSELRATGGYFGSAGILTVDQGNITHGNIGRIIWQPEGGLGLELISSEDAMGMNLRTTNINYTPEFTRVGYLMATAWEKYQNQHIDGVIATDPVFLQSLLGLTGGVIAADGTVVDGTNAAEELLHSVYFRYATNDEQDGFFADVASQALDNVMGNLGQIDKADFASTMGQGIEDHRLLMWMTDPSEQELITSVGASGALGDNPAQPELGVYINDETWAKMNWYLAADTTIGEGVANPDGTISYNVVTTLSSTATESELYYATGYVTGSSPLKRDTYDMAIIPMLVPPAGGTITDVYVDGYGSLEAFELYGREAYRGAVNLEPQETATISYRLTCAAGSETPTVRQTPLGQVRTSADETEVSA